MRRTTRSKGTFRRNVVFLAILLSMGFLMFRQLSNLGENGHVRWSLENESLAARESTKWTIGSNSSKISRQKSCDRGVECQMYDTAKSPVRVPIPASVAARFPLPPYHPPEQLGTSYRGVYRCDVNTGCPTYSAAFVASKEQLLSRPVTLVVYFVFLRQP